MGAKDSKPSFISYEDAVKRVSDSELRRIREAFKRCAGANGTALSLEAFVHEVLCDGVPYEVAEWLYQGCGGTKRGIAFKDLLCGIVVLTKGNIEEKIKFLWTLYTNNQGDNGTYIYKREFARTLHLENTSLPVTGAQRSAEILLGLFGQGDKVTFDQFRSWLLIHKDATVLSKWLLSDLIVSHDLETPTFYQSLAGVTHLEERDIIELEKCFWSLRHSAPTGELDLESLTPLLSPPLPPEAVAGTFLAFDENRDGHVDFKELCCGLSAACRGPRTERLKFCFKIFDLDSDGMLNDKELEDMVNILCSVAEEHARDQGSRASTPEQEEDEPSFSAESVLRDLRDRLAAHAASQHMIDLDETEDPSSPPPALSQEEFLIWAVERAEALVSPFLALLFETCHIVLGLRPQCRHHERNIVLGWLRRCEARGFRVGQLWYLVEAAWWRAWAAWARQPAACCPPDDLPGSSESMGSVWRCETGSLGSGSSSGHGSSPPEPRAPRPGPIDNSRLKEPCTDQVRSLTGEGGLVRRDVPLVQHRDFELVPDVLWRALAHWYSAPSPLPRQVIRPPNSDVELELYPLQLMIYRHVPSTQRAGAALCGAPERQLAYTAAFSRLATVKQVSEFLCGVLGLAREDVRLWALGAPAVLLDDERPALHELPLPARPRLLLEHRGSDLTWPEEIGALSGGGRATARRETLAAPELPGATGLHNLGNTCYMNAALQAVWNTGPLNRYFNSGMHLYELNTSNPLGTRGALALRLGELCKEVWSLRARSVAPLRVRWCVARHARALAGGGQHDAQELLAWLLDALHEDLKRAPRGSPPRPGPGDQAAASAAWAQHMTRNESILTELFCGQLKSRVKCDVCAHESVTFDVFNMLSLPLPMEASVRVHVRVILQDGSVPVRYGVRVSSEGSYRDLKENLSKLCGLPASNMLVTELSGAALGRVFPEAGRVAARDLLAYELPRGCRRHGWATSEGADGTTGAAGAWRAERSQSEVLMSQSPPSTFLRSHSIYTDSTDASRSSTLPKESRRPPPSPSPSARSLDARPLPRALAALGDTVTYIMAVHRKQCRADAYFLASSRSRPQLFGVPLLVGLVPGTSGRELHAAVWAQVARLLSPRPPATDRNHAADCDDSLGYEFPFTLRLVSRAGGAWCGRCAWHRHCRGCALPACDRPLVSHGPIPPRKSSSATTSLIDDLPNANSPIAKAKLQRQASARGLNEDGALEVLDLRALGGGAGGLARGAALAIDWEPTALHLRYQAARERAARDHASVGQEAAAAAAAVDLGSCLRAFTSPERLEERYHCSACAHNQPATKTLQLWRAPPILIIHLKRFQYVNSKWIKSQKVVNFPFEDFDPTDYLASVPRETILRAREIARLAREGDAGEGEDEGELEGEDEGELEGEDEGEVEPAEMKERAGALRRARLESTSLRAAPVRDDDLQDLHQHRLRPRADPLDLRYRLYAVVSHSGQLSGGHYVSFARHPSGAWLAYNDSSCRELPVTPPSSHPHIDPAAAYLLFYERQGLDYEQYLPDISGREPVVKDSEALDPDESDLKKMCVVA